MTRILLVEDEPAIATGVRDDLELEGYSVDVVTDGVTASTRGVQGQYDLILLDLMLPGKDGYTVCRELRAAGVRTPLLMLTHMATNARTSGSRPDRVAGGGLAPAGIASRSWRCRRVDATEDCNRAGMGVTVATSSSVRDWISLTRSCSSCSVRGC